MKPIAICIPLICAFGIGPERHPRRSRIVQGARISTWGHLTIAWEFALERAVAGAARWLWRDPICGAALRVAAAAGTVYACITVIAWGRA